MPDMRPLAVVDGLLRQPEAPRRSPADLDDHERGRRTRVDRHEIELVTADMDIPGRTVQPDAEKADQDQQFGGVTCLLGGGPGGAGAGRAFHGVA